MCLQQTKQQKHDMPMHYANVDKTTVISKLLDRSDLSFTIAQGMLSNFGAKSTKLDNPAIPPVSSQWHSEMDCRIATTAM